MWIYSTTCPTRLVRLTKREKEKKERKKKSPSSDKETDSYNENIWRETAQTQIWDKDRVRDKEEERQIAHGTEKHVEEEEEGIFPP